MITVVYRKCKMSTTSETSKELQTERSEGTGAGPRSMRGFLTTLEAVARVLGELLFGY